MPEAGCYSIFPQHEHEDEEQAIIAIDSAADLGNTRATNYFVADQQYLALLERTRPSEVPPSSTKASSCSFHSCSRPPLLQFFTTTHYRHFFCRLYFWPRACCSHAGVIAATSTAYRYSLNSVRCRASNKTLPTHPINLHLHPYSAQLHPLSLPITLIIMDICP